MKFFARMINRDNVLSRSKGKYCVCLKKCKYHPEKKERVSLSTSVLAFTEVSRKILTEIEMEYQNTSSPKLHFYTCAIGYAHYITGIPHAAAWHFLWSAGMGIMLVYIRLTYRQGCGIWVIYGNFIENRCSYFISYSHYHEIRAGLHTSLNSRIQAGFLTLKCSSLIDNDNELRDARRKGLSRLKSTWDEKQAWYS